MQELLSVVLSLHRALLVGDEDRPKLIFRSSRAGSSTCAVKRYLTPRSKYNQGCLFKVVLDRQANVHGPPEAATLSV